MNLKSFFGLSVGLMIFGISQSSYSVDRCDYQPFIGMGAQGAQAYPVCAAPSFSAQDSSGESLTGFKVEKETSSYVALRYRDGQLFTLSKARFAAEADANEFCKTQNAQLDTDFSAVLMAMSGEASANPFVGDSIRFKQGRYSGIASWAGSNENTIVVMLDGHGDDTEEFSMSELRENGFDLKLPAICVSKTKASRSYQTSPF